MATALEPGPLAHAERFYVPELDALRFFAFLAVFIDHIALHLRISPPLAHLGACGVDLFFTLSAYLLTELMLREKETTGRLDIKRFYIRRALRIWPLYFAFMLVVLVTVSIRPIAGIPITALAAYVALLGDVPLVYTSSLVVVSLWSISLEEQFYLLWPHFVRWVSRDKIAVVGGGLWLFCILLRLWIFTHGRGLFWLIILTHLDSIACGIVLVRIPARRHPLLCLLGFGCWALALAYIYSTSVAPIPATIAFALIGIGSGAFLWSALGTNWMRNGALVYLGRISYGLYIFHGAAIVLTAVLPPFIGIPASLLLTLAAASISYRWFESPFLKLKQRYQYVELQPLHSPRRQRPVFTQQ